jgi:hypothetical protein
MAADWRSDDWKHVEQEVKRLLQNQRDLLENPATGYRDKLLANGAILAYKTILKMPPAIPQAAKGK